ncbi:hypothetical protein Tcan_07812 [Toxocara canis]|uniref:Uncharacterized protein n=1 Tax=Toxocara canis TaxID=6265 RepID=A0A0B2VYU6_TOXCA|nr:hypothetical protein Tcan_07812 [Toxocara canis]
MISSFHFRFSTGFNRRTAVSEFQKEKKPRNTISNFTVIESTHTRPYGEQVFANGSMTSAQVETGLRNVAKLKQPKAEIIIESRNRRRQVHMSQHFTVTIKL